MPKVTPVGFGEAAVALGDVVRDRQRGAVELIGEEPIATPELLGVVADFVREIHGLLIDKQFLEAEGHERRR